MDHLLHRVGDSGVGRMPPCLLSLPNEVLDLVVLGGTLSSGDLMACAQVSRRLEDVIVSLMAQEAFWNACWQAVVASASFCGFVHWRWSVSQDCATCAPFEVSRTCVQRVFFLSAEVEALLRRRRSDVVLPSSLVSMRLRLAAWSNPVGHCRQSHSARSVLLWTESAACALCSSLRDAKLSGVSLYLEPVGCCCTLVVRLGRALRSSSLSSLGLGGVCLCDVPSPCGQEYCRRFVGLVGHLFEEDRVHALECDERERSL